MEVVRRQTRSLVDLIRRFYVPQVRSLTSATLARGVALKIAPKTSRGLALRFERPASCAYRMRDAMIESPFRVPRSVDESQIRRCPCYQQS
eukprot:c1751_g1_i1.p1 GENE.c1751_g1_i1~~c1751_g1_i1.p1  ORF type:complete len:103 (-),score=13.13 c1751_g1_i1:127-399(-)